MAGLKVYDDNGKVIFDDTMRLFKLMGVTTVQGGRQRYGGVDEGFFQIPLTGNQKAVIFLTDHLSQFDPYDNAYIKLNEDTGLVSYYTPKPITFAYGCW